MAFNARWTLEGLAAQIGVSVDGLLAQFREDLTQLAKEAPVLQLGVRPSGNCFTLTDASGGTYRPPSEAGLYAIFTRDAVVYFGEATNLLRRHLFDADNTAASNKVFSNQGRAILKLLLHKGWTDCLGLGNLYMQIYAENQVLTLHEGKSFGSVYLVSDYSKALEGVGALVIDSLHAHMYGAAQRQTVLRYSDA